MPHLLDAFGLLIWPLAACICIGLLHAYAGLHVLRRGIIFVDLALAQMAALGAVVGALVAPHLEATHALETQAAHAPPPVVSPTSAASELEAALAEVSSAPPVAAADPAEHAAAGGILSFWPTLFALAGAVLLSFSRVSNERVPHEAIIGIVYVVAAAATVLILSKSPQAHEQMEEMLTGRLLFVDRAGVLATAGLYAVLGVLHWLLRRPFLYISEHTAAGGHPGLAVRLWDCVFYAMFALMVTRSVAIGGVLVVFSYLIIPGACAALFADGWAARIGLAWLLATVISVLGLGLSVLGDLPSGSTLVAVFGAALVICAVLAWLGRVLGLKPECAVESRVQEGV